MSQPDFGTKISVTCPSGHRLRGGVLLLGKTVRCPKCHDEFVFAPTAPPVNNGRSVSDTGVMRILGEMPTAPVAEPPTLPRQPQRPENVTDSRVMRILDTEAQVNGEDPAAKSSAPLRPCSRCGVQISENLAVCNHCHCYVGVLPSYLTQISADAARRA